MKLFFSSCTRLLVLLLIIGTGGCQQSGEPTPRLSSLEVPLVTGFIFKDDRGSALWPVGNPNNKTLAEVNQSSIGINTFPNPVLYQLYIGLNVEGNPAPGPVVAWITPARLTDALQLQFSFANAVVKEIGGAPIAWVKTETAVRSLSIPIPAATPPGAYRLYVQIGETLLWDNVLVVDQSFQF